MTTPPRSAPLEPEQAGILIGRIRWYLGSEDLGAQARQDLADFEMKPELTFEYGKTLVEFSTLWREVERGEVALDPTTVRLLGLLLAEAKKDLARSEAESRAEDVVSDQMRVHTLELLHDCWRRIVAEQRAEDEPQSAKCRCVLEPVVGVAVDLSNPYRRKIVVGICSEQVGRMLDDLGFEQHGGTDEGPHYPSDVVEKGVNAQRPYLAKLNKVDEWRWLLTAAVNGADKIPWPLEFNLAAAVKSALLELREGLTDDAPADYLGRTLGAINEAEKWLAELSKEESKGSVGGPVSSTPVDRHGVEALRMIALSQLGTSLDHDAVPLDITKPARRQIVIGIIGALIGSMADELGWETPGEREYDPPQVTTIFATGLDPIKPCAEKVSDLWVLAYVMQECVTAKSITWPVLWSEGQRETTFAKLLKENIKALREYLTDASPKELGTIATATLAAEEWLAELGAGGEPDGNG